MQTNYPQLGGLTLLRMMLYVQMYTASTRLPMTDATTVEAFDTDAGRLERLPRTCHADALIANYQVGVKCQPLISLTGE
jgi:hypothetical protein